MPGPPFKVKAVYDYSSPHEDDLNFNDGQIITVVAEEDADWYEGEYTDASGTKHKGLFPKNFVERHEPAVPSRPTRAQRPVSEVRSSPPPAPAPVQEPFPEAESSDDEDEAATDVPPSLPVQSKPVAPPAEAFAPPPPARETAASPPPAREEIRSPPPPAPVETAAPPPPAREQIKSPPPAPKPAAAEPAKGPPPPVSQKPSSFRDRIAAFNNASAAPITPFKPAAPPTGFIKKPFVAPPPSKNSYIPPPIKADPVPKVYRREEDPEIQETQAQAQENAERAGLAPSETTAPQNEEEEDQPKPTSLKERIALLQKQQMEQAARRADVSTKEKPKKPVKKRTDESTESSASVAPPVPQISTATEAESALVEDIPEREERQERYVERQSLDQPRERTRGASARRMSREPMSPAVGGDAYSDANDADQSAAGETTEENDADSDSTQPARESFQAIRAPAAPVKEADVGEQQDTTEDDEESEEDEMDAETRRRLELRERMAKMSGGMGMAGMFGGPPLGMTGGMPPKKKASKDPKPDTDEGPVSPSVQAPRVPMIPVPGMQTVRSPESENTQIGVEKESEPEATITSEREPSEVPDIEDVKPAEHLDRAPPVPQERPLMSPTSERAPPPPVPSGRPVPAPPAPEGRAVPPPPPAAGIPMSPTEGEESDDEMSSRAMRSSVDTTRTSDIPRPAPPQVPRPEANRSPSMTSKRASTFGSDIMSPSSPQTPGSERRQSRVPPIPGASPIISPPPQLRGPPPPPPPTAAPSQAPPVPTRAPIDEPDEGESEYEGDYDTDIASGDKHKDALKSHQRESSLEEGNIPGDIPAPAPVPRAVPPPPPSQPPPSRGSVDVPRAAPPPIPTRNVEPQYEEEEDEDEEYQEAPRPLPIRAVPPPPPMGSAPAPPPVQDEVDDSSDDLYRASPPRKSVDRPPPPPPTHEERAIAPPSQPPPSSYPPPPSRSSTRQSLDVSGRPSMSARRSMDVSRPTHDGHIATDVDLGEASLWWTQPNMPPPVFQNRSDVLCEIEESSVPRRGGKTTVSKDVYVLFIDYSQTVINARFDSQNPEDVGLEQRHEPPAPRLRQDQLETAWQKYGARISEAAAGKKDQVVGDGSPNALVLELLRPFKDALRPVGTRAYGALVYANLANASVQQHDEIRPGDIITLRNARLQGKHGAMHKSYSMEIGMGTGHVGVVVDWDGTKKKVRAWEQGREKQKCKMESFRLGDLRSGEVRVWRIVGREWVGWDS